MKEYDILQQIQRTIGKAPKGVIAGIGDDCAVLSCTKDKYLLCGTDMLIEGTHFIVKNNYEKIGMKAVSVNISDIAAMGGEAKYITASLGLSPGLTGISVRQLYKGIKNQCDKFGVSVVGGDINSSALLVINISIIGEVEKRNLVLRKNAKVNDIIFITGPVRDGERDHYDFKPRYYESRELVNKYKINAMIDTSDGIAPDLNRICRASGVGAEISQEKILLEKGLNINGALYWGESFELLFTMSQGEADKLVKKEVSGNRKRFFAIGKIVPRKYGVRIKTENGTYKRLKNEGFDHFGG